MNFDDLTYIMQNQLDEDFCKHVIEKFDKDDRKKEGVIGRGLDTSMKRSTDLYITKKEGWEEEDDIFYKSLSKNLESYMDWLSAPYDHFAGNYPSEDSGYQLQQTKPGEFYKYHHDQMGTRKLTFIWYLNDIIEGGDTEFSSGLKIQPETGKIVIFPALWPWVHRGNPPKSENKYICTGWIRSTDDADVS